MNKTFQKILNFSLVCLSTGCITSCDLTKHPNAERTCTVRFYDDSETPVLIGQTEVVKGGEAVFSSLNQQKPYDWMVKGDKAHEPGVTYVFDKWVGYYDENQQEPVDLNCVLEDCNVKVQFKKEPLKYQIMVKNFNKQRVLKDNNKILTLSWGETFLNLPQDVKLNLDNDVDGFSPIKENLLYGYSIDNVEITNNKYVTNKTQLLSKFYYGEGNPNEIKDQIYDFNTRVLINKNEPYLGSFYEDVLDKKMYCYLNNEWYLCGNFNKSQPIIRYEAKFNTVYKDYSVVIYKDKNKAEKLADIKATYGSEIVIGYDEIVENGKTIKAFNGIIQYRNEVGKRALNLKNNFTQEQLKSIKWSGIYGDNDNVDPKYRGKSIDNKKMIVAGDCELFTNI